MYKRKTTPFYKNFHKLTIFQWLLILLGVLLLFPLFRFLRAQLQKNKEQKTELDIKTNFVNNKDELTLNSKLDKITPTKSIQKAAKDLAHHFGTKYSDTDSWFDWLNPQGWTENDKEIEKILIYQRNNYALLVRIYKEVTNNRSLSNDIRRYLDDTNQKNVSKYLNF